MSTKTIPQESNSLGFTIHGGRVEYTASLSDWACILKALNQIDVDELLKDDLHRCLLSLWRDGLRAAVLCGYGLAFFSSKELKEFKKEVAPLVDVGRQPDPRRLEVEESQVSYGATPEDWSFLWKSLAAINLEKAPMDDASRTILTVWRVAIHDAIVHCVDLAWMVPSQIERVESYCLGVAA